HHADGVQVELVFNRAHLRDDEVTRLRQRLATACDAVLQGHAGPIGCLPLMPAEEVQQVLHGFNQHDCSFSEDK
ncbi:hypothetical protein ACSTHN_00025, partial [Vibrio parahaemolyticus]